MSSRTRTQFSIRTTDSTTLNLSKLNDILGEGGRDLVLKTMRSFCDGTHGLNYDGNTEGQFAWEAFPKDAGQSESLQKDATQTESFRLTLTRDSLSPSMKGEGVNNLQVDLTFDFDNGLVKVAHHVNAIKGSKILPQAVLVEAEQMATRAVNRALSVAVAQRLAHRLEEHVQQRLRQPVQQRVEQAVQLHMSQNFMVRAYAMVGG